MGLAWTAGWVIVQCRDALQSPDEQPASQQSLQRRHYDEERARRDMEEALDAANSEVDVWRNKGGM